MIRVALPIVLTLAPLMAGAQGTLSGLARFEMPKKIALIPGEFSVESGEMTPTLKVKRRVVERMCAAGYAELRDELQALGGGVEGARGRFHDLAESFDRVNARYFGGL